MLPVKWVGDDRPDEHADDYGDNTLSTSCEFDLR